MHDIAKTIRSKLNLIMIKCKIDRKKTFANFKLYINKSMYKHILLQEYILLALIIQIEAKTQVYLVTIILPFIYLYMVQRTSNFFNH